ncbi:MAG: hypothetical protein JW876_04705 [Candidatus Krumholzibacteriota bacterium]|nr:hypothetical protein [Candidatus Krumholzibacteriota bacterium]
MARDAERKPVLTSPWKIGTLVALLMVMTGIGVTYYIVDVYGVEFSWLSPSEGFPGFRLDSFGFFREMYPMVAAVIGLSLLSYFVVASAVRRYRFYLSSGQDYRRMISLADSIDDLTNPAQIGKLSGYPELQRVLRNYGDQIRDISSALEQKERESKSIDFEMEIDSLLRGEPVDDSNIDGRWWAPIFRRIQEHMEASAANEGDTCDKEEIRRLVGRVLLTNGKVFESVSGASEDLIEIARAVGELDGVSARLDETPGTSAGPVDARCLDEIETALRGIEQGGGVLNEFSEETNGIALNLALMAARGAVDEHELAAFAEKARSTAERFRRLGGTVAGLTKSMLDALQRARAGTGASRAAAPDESGSMRASIADISGRIEQSSMRLQDRVCSLTGEIEDVGSFLRNWMDGEAGTDDHAPSRSDGDFVNYGAGEHEKTPEDDLVIDHGESWQNVGGFTGMFAGGDSEPAADGEPSAGREPADETVVREPAEPAAVEERLFDETTEPMDTSRSHEAFNEISLERIVEAAGFGARATGKPGEEPVDRTPAPMPATADDAPFAGEPAAAPEQESARAAEPVSKDPPAVGGGEGWMEMPGRERVRVDVEVDRDQAFDIPVDGIGGDPAEAAQNEPAVEERSGTATDGGEPVHDLFELGAVEYTEETQTQR